MASEKPDTPSKLTRWRQQAGPEGECTPLASHKSGDWVPYSEAAALEQRNQELEAQNERLRDALKVIDHYYPPGVNPGIDDALESVRLTLYGDTARSLSGAPTNGE